MSFTSALLLGVVIAEAIAIAFLLVALSLTRQVAASRASRLREALNELAHAKNLLLLKEQPIEKLEEMLVDAGVLRASGVFDRSRK